MKHKCVILAWPYQKHLWRNCNIRQHFRLFLEQVLQYSSVRLLCPLRYQNQIQISHKDLTLVDIDYNDIWVQDYCFLTSNKGRLIYKFNGWGNQHSHTKDCQVAQKLSLLDKKNMHFIPIAIEGGALEFNSNSLITTRDVLFSSRRNNFSFAEISKLWQNFGIENIILINHGLCNDDTNGHIDNVCRFVDENTVLLMQSRDKTDPNYTSLMQAYKQLSQENFNIITCFLPKFRKEYCASYANFLILNDAVLCPIFYQKEDEEALNTLQKCFPNKKIIGLYSDVFLKEGGALHCLTGIQY